MKGLTLVEVLVRRAEPEAWPLLRLATVLGRY